MSYAASSVTVRAGAATLLADVSIEVRPGELVAVAGPNGAGKTTLLATLAGDRRPDGGVIRLAGRDVSAWSRRELAIQRAVMGTERSVAFPYTAEEVAMLGRLPLHGGDPNEDDRRIVRSLMEAVDCVNLAGRPYATLSTGERQRVQLARAIAQVVDPDEAPSVSGERYVLLDEPTSSLDPAHQHAAMRLLRRQAQAGRGVLAVLHDLNLAAAYADRLVLLSAGRIAASGAVSEVLRTDTLSAVFGMPMLVLPHPRSRYPMVLADPPSDR